MAVVRVVGEAGGADAGWCGRWRGNTAIARGTKSAQVHFPLVQDITGAGAWSEVPAGGTTSELTTRDS